ncbi:lambda-crystallin homolog [Drosophila sulfurigaster albostrigata]|uniref:lambda-crystallin homolog n=1 Tax=Drosophila sulfurigaster albostrigata TaxID=89887 RepID=UPI002D21A23D|nr:lambda-crystallin homolog [Drosophila sulfurigaster albostrigata]
MSCQKIGIVGSGLIGRAWAMLFAAAGYRVQLYDILETQVDGALLEIQKELHSLKAKGALRGQLSPEAQFELISGCTDLKQLVENALHIQECIPEQLQLKRDLYAQLDEVLESQTVVASSTSTFMPSLYTEGLKQRSQMLVAHPLNPPYFIPLVELVPAPWTNKETVESTRQLMLALGQRPVVLNREVQGFATNRIQYAILNEVWRLVGGGIISVEDVDRVLSDGLGLRYALLGSLETAHLNAPGGVADYFQRFGGEIAAVSASYGPTPDMRNEGETLAEIARQCEELVPLEKLQQRRATRDEFLTRLSTLKRQLL